MNKLKDTDIQSLLGKVLRAGTVMSMSIVFLGGILYIYRHGYSVVNYHKFTGIPDFVQYTSRLIPGAISFKGQAIIQIGIILLIFTPILRVFVSSIGFLLEKDYLYTFISLVVLAIIFASMLSGHAG
jgi:uncharacterized membrane protein